MKFTKFDSLRIVVESLGASPVIAELELQLINDGISVENNPESVVVGDQGIYYVDPSGALTKVVIHIVDKNLNSRYARVLSRLVQENKFEEKELINEVHRYHLVKCNTIERAENEGWRKDRYKMSRRIDGKFFYRFIRDNLVVEERKSQKLLVCKNCLNVINKLDDFNYSTESMDLEAFLKTDVQKTYGLPEISDYADICAPNVYPPDWKGISVKYRKLKNFQCENAACPAPDLSEQQYRRYLHTHHVSHDVTNNSYLNLRALCIFCHANQSGHGQLKSLPDYKRYVMLRNLK